MLNQNHKVSFGAASSPKVNAVQTIKASLAQALMQDGLPGAFTLDLSKCGVPGVSGSLILKPTISKKDGRVMYNQSGDGVIIGGKDIQVGVKPMGNWLLPKEPFTVDADTLKAYQAATAERDASRKTRAPQTDAELDEGESTE